MGIEPIANSLSPVQSVGLRPLRRYFGPRKRPVVVYIPN